MLLSQLAFTGHVIFPHSEMVGGEVCKKWNHYFRHLLPKNVLYITPLNHLWPHQTITLHKIAVWFHYFARSLSTNTVYWILQPFCYNKVRTFSVFTKYLLRNLHNQRSKGQTKCCIWYFMNSMFYTKCFKRQRQEVQTSSRSKTFFRCLMTSWLVWKIFLIIYLSDMTSN